MSDVAELQEHALKVRQLYSRLNKEDNQKAWGGKEYAMGFVGDVGDLLKLVMAKEKFRQIDDVDTKLAHELADCLWCVLVLADYYGINIEKEFLQTMNELETEINGALA